MSELLTASEAARILKCSEDTVVRRFARVKGVIDLGTGEARNKRRYRILRIPVSVVEKYLAERSGAPVKIEIPPTPERRRKTPSWERQAILNLAKAAKQNDCTDRKVFARIAAHARSLAAHVPETQWKEIEWAETDDVHYNIVLEGDLEILEGE